MTKKFFRMHQNEQNSSLSMAAASSRRGRIRSLVSLTLVAFASLIFGVSGVFAQTRVKDIASFEGVRENQLVGYGLVVGLGRTGDTLRNSPFTQESLRGMMDRLGVSIGDARMQTRNVAAVMVTATLPPFARQGSRIDVSVNAMGDATSLTGGTLLVTSLLAADGLTYAVAQGAVLAGGFQAQGQAASVQQGVPTAARIPGGALVEREVGVDVNRLPNVRIALRSPDFTTASRMAMAINRQVGMGIAKMLDSGTIDILVPPAFNGRVGDLMARIEGVEVTPDNAAKVVVDERTGTIVMGDRVRISTVAVSQGGLTVRVTETPQVSQPSPFSNGETRVVPRTAIDVQSDPNAANGGRNERVAVLEGPVTLGELVKGLNALGVGPREMISILQAIKSAGALHADLQVN
jgi:flagellar P-ring protein precursor FlgI